MNEDIVPRFLEEKLKKEYAGEDPSIPYKIMNSKGYMRGSKETPKGAALERKHEEDKGKKHKKVQNPRSHHQKLKHG